MKGVLIVITGCMFSGKTTKLIALAQKALTDKKNIIIYYPNIDTRYKKNYVVSHDSVQLPSIPLPLGVDTIDAKGKTVVFLDEVQFFSPHILIAVENLLDKGIDVVAAGLNKDYRAENFGSVPALMHMADEVIELQAKCNTCGQPAIYTFRVNAKSDEETIVVGGTDMYEARCEEHYVKPV